MRLSITPDANEDGSVFSFWLYDEKTHQGVSLTRDIEDKRIEVMVPDQNCYTLISAKITFTESLFEIEMSDGTIDPNKGSNHYYAEFEKLERKKYFKILSILEKIVGENKDVKLNEA